MLAHAREASERSKLGVERWADQCCATLAIRRPPFDGAVRALAAVAGQAEAALVEPDFREGPTNAKPIVSPMQMVRCGAEFWVSSGEGRAARSKGDRENATRLRRVSDALGIESDVFDVSAGSKGRATWAGSACPTGMGGASGSAEAGRSGKAVAEVEAERPRAGAGPRAACGGALGSGSAGGGGACA
ncbi:unnamed protein product [Prorocentrum cordatum]|uniref:Uncharacterized protein n=1 Tax=Prorocentrum cordatum TaxID=2364126 RepID=A0ABN9XP97_9DINO|nr:unnamed protein product [Polarella glacialis]